MVGTRMIIFNAPLTVPTREAIKKNKYDCSYKDASVEQMLLETFIHS